MIKFGPSGNSLSFYEEGYKTTEQAAKWIRDKGLNCFEYSFGRGANLTEQKAQSIGRAFNEQDVEISCHAPYFINFANESEDMVAKSYQYVLSTAKRLKWMGGKRCVFHPAAQGKLTRERAVTLTLDRLKVLRDLIYENGYDDLLFCPETMGKQAQIGTVEEIAKFCKIDKIYIPTIDFGHINARENGSLKTVKDYKDRLLYLISELGMEKMQNFHVHFSKISYSQKGELKHLTFSDDVFGPPFEPLAVALKELNLTPHILSEADGTQAEEAVIMKNVYFNL